jgi:hypothetical protein
MADERKSAEEREAEERNEDLEIPDETAEQVKGGKPGLKMPKKQSDKL